MAAETKKSLNKMGKYKDIKDEDSEDSYGYSSGEDPPINKTRTLKVTDDVQPEPEDKSRRRRRRGRRSRSRRSRRRRSRSRRR